MQPTRSVNSNNNAIVSQQTTTQSQGSSIDTQVQSVVQYNFKENVFRDFHKDAQYQYPQNQVAYSIAEMEWDSKVTLSFCENKTSMETWFKIIKELILWAKKGEQRPEVNRSCAAHSIENAVVTQPPKLVLADRRLVSVPKEIGFLWKLVELNLVLNMLTTLPDEFCHMENLQILGLRSNKFKVLPGVIGKLPRLEKLCVLGNDLEEISDGVCDSKSLKVVVLSNNKLKRLPVRLSQMTRLWYLNLSDNEFTELPDQLGDMPKLHTLDLIGNKNLTSLPESLRSCASLEVLDISATGMDWRISKEILEATMALRKEENKEN